MSLRYSVRRCMSAIYVVRCMSAIYVVIFIDHFQQKSPIFSGSLVESDLQLRGSYESCVACIKRITCVLYDVFNMKCFI